MISSSLAHEASPTFEFYSASNPVAFPVLHTYQKTSALPINSTFAHMTVHTAADGGPTSYFGFDDALSSQTQADSSDRGFKRAYSACSGANDPERAKSCDFEDPSGVDQYKWHIGINRTVGSAARHGSGVRRVCLVFGNAGSLASNCLKGASACFDKILNGAETDLDCGGVECRPCDAGKHCLQNNDCVSGVCSGTICQAPTCTDALQNGDETDVNCGGSCATKCAPGKKCFINGDCASGSCNGTMCNLFNQDLNEL